MYRNNFVNNLNKINGLENRLHVIQMMKARLGQEAAMLSTFQPQPFLAITFLKGGECFGFYLLVTIFPYFDVYV